MIERTKKIKWIAGTSIFCAISIVLYFFVKFPLPIFPSFLEVNFSMLAIILATVCYGIWSGIACVVIRCLIKLPFSHTMYVGELADVLLGAIVVCMIALILHLLKDKNKNLAMIIALIGGIIAWAIAGVLANWLILLPFYMKAFGMTPEAIVGAMSMIKGVTTDNYMIMYLFAAVMPFNLMLGSVVSLVTYFVWRALAKARMTTL